ncbi:MULTISPECIES: plasmid IncI1-type surface exclusion protein ExcA [Enterobacteriaceae]|uniref:Plasmid IncI1-type surface exclusion protein ExcA n=1 Tax=Citrobacter telavivensis TaxID=2653932 RepID=A0A6L5EFT3_9ENTR|nr:MULTISPECIES: plasmid IncI1-type surface exclusion protein ExcA [Enterobacteriaceae]HDR2614472.1 plasmid IncI1-type surface exclusion protein ExcA [Enterobacter ludwigii]KLV69575.1 hypothetical protein SK37_05054 [Citrobacter sp. MGH109]MDT7093022.1 plasmid IncI1-type surface exclusion protein ExcA [Citrobacter freundii]MPQ54357.1 plasmid IncI1-type surface exclusion protein ExcA [Citrobacter telavivensis]QFS69075.1 plasmid IncI1-type surface exclusion protein ExcA [Citrobacter telavivensis
MVDRYPKWWFFYLVAKSLFYVAGILSLIFYGIVYITVANSYDEYIIGFGCWVLLVAPFAVNYFIAKKRKQKIQSALVEIKATGHFNPTKESEAWFFWKNTYLGFDYHKGTIVYIRIYPGNVMDVIGFDAYSLTRTEVEGSKLRLYTKLASLPMIPIDTYAASNLANHIHAMNNKGYSYNFNFPEIVKQKRQKLESLAGMPVPDLV